MRIFFLVVFLTSGLFCAGQTARKEPPCPDLGRAKSAGNSQYVGAVLCRVMTGSAEERESGFAILREEARQENQEAMHTLSGALRMVPDARFRDEAQAVLLLEKLVAKGSSRAKGDLGSVLLNGDGVEQDVNRGETMLNEAANAGDPTATFALFIEYRKGYRLPRDVSRLDELLERLKKMKGMQAAISLQVAEQMLAREKGDEETLLSRAESGHFQAQYHVGKRKLDSQEYEEARKWLQKSADQKFPIAIKELAEMHDRGLGVKKDPAEAARLYVQAAELGYVPAQIRLADKYLVGDGVEKNPEYGLFWLKVAALVGSSKATVQFKAESDKIPSPLVAKANAKAEEYVKLHPEFLRQKDGMYREVRMFPTSPAQSR